MVAPALILAGLSLAAPLIQGITSGLGQRAQIGLSGRRAPARRPARRAPRRGPSIPYGYNAPPAAGFSAGLLGLQTVPKPQNMLIPPAIDPYMMALAQGYRPPAAARAPAPARAPRPPASIYGGGIVGGVGNIPPPAVESTPGWTIISEAARGGYAGSTIVGFAGEALPRYEVLY